MLGLLRKKRGEAPKFEARDSEEKRQNRRHAVLMKATIYPVDVYSDIVIQNASRTGMMGEADIALELDQAIQLTLDQRSFHGGVVRWTRGRRFGVDLQDPLDIVGLGTNIDHGSAIGHKPRAERVALNLPARLSTGQPRPATIRNLSRRGLLLETQDGLLAGQQILIRVGDRPLFAGRVQWSDDGRIGVSTDADVPILTMLYAED